MSLNSRIVNSLLFAFCIQTYPEAAFENTTQPEPDRVFRLYEGTSKASSLTKFVSFANGYDDLEREKAFIRNVHLSNHPSIIYLIKITQQR